MSSLETLIKRNKITIAGRPLFYSLFEKENKKELFLCCNFFHSVESGSGLKPSNLLFIECMVKGNVFLGTITMFESSNNGLEKKLKNKYIEKILFKKGILIFPSNHLLVQVQN